MKKCAFCGFEGETTNYSDKENNYAENAFLECMVASEYDRNCHYVMVICPKCGIVQRGIQR